MVRTIPPSFVSKTVRVRAYKQASVSRVQIAVEVGGREFITDRHGAIELGCLLVQAIKDADDTNNLVEATYARHIEVIEDEEE